MERPLVSVIIPNYNSPVIGKVLDALFSQTYNSRFEVIVAGIDKQGLIKPRPGLTFIDTKTRKNPAEARNICIRNAKGSIFALLDADCIPRSDWLERLVETPNEIVMGSVDFSSSNFWVFCDNFVHFYGSHFTKRGEERPFLSTYNVKIPRSAFDRIGLFNEALETAEDDEFFLRARRAGYKMFFEPAAIVNHQPNRNSFSSVLRHSMYWSENAIKVRSAFPEYKLIPWFIRSRCARLLLSPAIALAVTLRIYMHAPFLKYLYIAPIVYACKIAWLAGSFRGKSAKWA